jgi:hypothetical protein
MMLDINCIDSVVREQRKSLLILSKVRPSLMGEDLHRTKRISQTNGGLVR